MGGLGACGTAGGGGCAGPAPAVEGVGEVMLVPAEATDVLPVVGEETTDPSLPRFVGLRESGDV